MLAVTCERVGRVLVWTSQIRTITNTPEGTITTIDCPCGRRAFVAAGSERVEHVGAESAKPEAPSRGAELVPGR